MTRDQLYVKFYSYIIDKNLIVSDISVGENDDPGRFIMRKDDEAEAGQCQYKVFGEIFDKYDYRMVFGGDEKENFDRIFDEYGKMSNGIPVFKSILEDDPNYAVTGFTPANGKTNGYYTVQIKIKGEDGVEENLPLLVYVETVGDETHICRLEGCDPSGAVLSYNELHYGDEAWNFDGETYTPGLEQECYPTEEYLKQVGGDVHSMKVAYPDKTVEYKTLSSVKMIPYSATGTFNFDMNGKQVSMSKFKVDTEELAFLNPKTEKGFGDAPTELTWKAN